MLFIENLYFWGKFGLRNDKFVFVDPFLMLYQLQYCMFCLSYFSADVNISRLKEFYEMN